MISPSFFCSSQLSASSGISLARVIVDRSRTEVINNFEKIVKNDGFIVKFLSS